VRRRNHDPIARTEFVAMGVDFNLQLTRSIESWGASRPSWLYSATLNDGFSLPWGHDLLATAVAERRVGASGAAFSHEGGTLRYYAPQGRYTAFYGFFSADRVRNATAPDLLLLGGDSGLRGYPQRYQAGDQRVVATLEQRIYTDWYIFRLVRIGGAVFVDAGRAWKGANPNLVNGGWLADAGVGLRLAIDRAAFANVLHIDIAMPFDREPGIKGVQYLVKTHLTF